MDKQTEQALFERIRKEGQGQILRFWEELTDDQKDSLKKQIEGIDFQMIRASMQQPNLAMESVISPLHTFTCEEQEAEKETDRKLGEEIIRQGKVAALVLAGGQGSRLQIHRGHSSVSRRQLVGLGYRSAECFPG